MKKAYFTTPNLIFALNHTYEHLLPKFLENLIATKKDVKYFYRNRYEIDFISVNGKREAIEVKWEGKKVRQLKKFISGKKVSKKIDNYFLVDLGKEGKEGGIRIIPVWKFLLEEKADFRLVD